MKFKDFLTNLAKQINENEGEDFLQIVEDYKNLKEAATPATQAISMEEVVLDFDEETSLLQEDQNEKLTLDGAISLFLTNLGQNKRGFDELFKDKKAFLQIMLIEAIIQEAEKGVIKGKKVESVEELMELGADLNIISAKNNLTPFEFAKQQCSACVPFLEKFLPKTDPQKPSAKAKSTVCAIS